MAPTHATAFVVMWVIGCCMILMAGVIWLPPKVVAALGVLTVASHNILDFLKLPSCTFITFFLRPNVIKLGDYFIIIGYVILPWLGVMAAGYGFGMIAIKPREKRIRLTFRLGLALTGAFVLLRFANVYGDPSHWKETLASFVNTQKYPPSLLFTLMTIGPALILLSAIDRARATRGPFIVYGRVPLFYYVAHFFYLFLLAVLAATFKDGNPWPFLWPKLGPPSGVPDSWGHSLAMVYAIWIFVVATLYPLCRWFADLKSRQKAWWISIL